jgi:hypothetical protein
MRALSNKKKIKTIRRRYEFGKLKLWQSTYGQRAAREQFLFRVGIFAVCLGRVAFI